MNTRRLHLLAVVLAVFGIGLNTAFGREPSAIVEDIREAIPVMEEVTVNGSDDAAAYRANKARFEAQMAAFARSVHARYRDTVRNRLEHSVHGTAPWRRPRAFADGAAVSPRRL